MSATLSVKKKFTRKDGNSAGSIKKAIIVEQSSGSTTIKTYMRKRRNK